MVLFRLPWPRGIEPGKIASHQIDKSIVGPLAPSTHLARVHRFQSKSSEPTIKCKNSIHCLGVEDTLRFGLKGLIVTSRNGNGKCHYDNLMPGSMSLDGVQALKDI